MQKKYAIFKTIMQDGDQRAFNKVFDTSIEG